MDVNEDEGDDDGIEFNSELNLDAVSPNPHEDSTIFIDLTLILGVKLLYNDINEGANVSLIFIPASKDFK